MLKYAIAVKKIFLLLRKQRKKILIKYLKADIGLCFLFDNIFLSFHHIIYKFVEGINVAFSSVL